MIKRIIQILMFCIYFPLSPFAMLIGIPVYIFTGRNMDWWVDVLFWIEDFA